MHMLERLCAGNTCWAREYCAKSLEAVSLNPPKHKFNAGTLVLCQAVHLTKRITDLPSARFMLNLEDSNCPRELSGLKQFLVQSNAYAQFIPLDGASRQE